LRQTDSECAIKTAGRYFVLHNIIALPAGISDKKICSVFT